MTCFCSNDKLYKINQSYFWNVKNIRCKICKLTRNHCLYLHPCCTVQCTGICSVFSYLFFLSSDSIGACNKQSLPVCNSVEQQYLLSAVAGRRQDDRPSITHQNKVKRFLSIRDFIPGEVNPPQILQINMLRGGNVGINWAEWLKGFFNLQPAPFSC